MKDINICFLTDNGYVMQTCVAIYSLLKNRSSESKYNIYILCNDVSKKNKDFFSVMNGDNFKINIIDLDFDKSFEKLDKDVPASPTAICKFQIPNILSHLDRVLYLDGDIIINKDLFELYNVDLQKKYIGAIKDTSGLSRSLYNLFIKKNIFYFNSGVMVMDLKKMRENHISDKLIDYRIHGYNDLMDQDSLNYVLNKNVLELPFMYNTQLMFSTITHSDVNSLKKYFHLSDKYSSISSILNDAYIIHYSGKKKPWKHLDGCQHDLWFEFYKKCPYGVNELKRVKYDKKKKNISMKIKEKITNLKRYFFMLNFTNEK